MAAEKVFYATGKRKTSSARVFLRPGSGKITVNGKELLKYLQVASQQSVVYLPLQLTNTKTKFDATVTVAGGGYNAQVEAIRHGISRALLAVDPTYREELKKAGLLTRDARMVERKKYGKHKARRSTQFSKR